MPQKFAFTTAAMAAALEETPVSYEDLADIERAFDDAETDISECTSVSCAAGVGAVCGKSLRYHIRSSLPPCYPEKPPGLLQHHVPLPQTSIIDCAINGTTSSVLREDDVLILE